jgi:Fe-S oxidoreductase/nitrate reductase gamma subunit
VSGESNLYFSEIYGYPVLDVTRDLLFNLGGMSGFIHLVWYLFVIIAALSFFISLYRKIKIWQRGLREHSSFNPFKRIKILIKYIIFHKKLLRDPYGWFLHIFVFYGFLGFISSRIFAYVVVDIWQFFTGKNIFYGNLYLIWALCSDIFGILIILGILMSWYRRAVISPSRLKTGASDKFALIMMALVVLTAFLDEALYIRLVDFPQFEIWTPVGYGFAHIFKIVPDSFLKFAHYINWWVHTIIFFSIFGLLATGRFGYISFAFINILKLNINNEKYPAKYRVKISKPEELNANKTTQGFEITNFTSKQRLDLDACIECGLCQDACPAWVVDKKLSPKKFIQDLKKSMYDEVNGINSPVVENYVTREELWACTLCGACEEVCPVNIEHMQKVIELRKSEVHNNAGASSFENIFKSIEKTSFNYLDFYKSKKPAAVITFDTSSKANKNIPASLAKNMESVSNSLASHTASVRDLNWLLNIQGVNLISEENDADYLFFVGCSAYRNKKTRDSVSAFLKTLTSAGSTVAILGDEEFCCGDSALRAGNEALFRRLALKNIEKFNKYNVKKIITHCPHGYNVLKKEYKVLAGSRYSYEIEIFYSLEVLSQLIEKNKLVVQKNYDHVVTYHDPCMLARYNGLYKTPRKIIKHLSGSIYVEMRRNRKEGMCCGGGGAHNWINMKNGAGFNEYRANEAYSSGATVLLTSCPFCKNLLTNGVQKIKSGNIEVLDIAEFVFMNLQK